MIAIIALLAAPAKGALAGDIMVMNAMAPESLTPAARSAVVYMSIMNHGTAADTLLSVATRAAALATIHSTTMENDVVRMTEVGSLVIPAGSTVTLAQAATHVMLTGLQEPLMQGKRLSLTLTFERAGEVAVEVPVVDIRALPAADHNHPEDLGN